MIWLTLKPAARRALSAPAAGSPTTPGTVVVAGAVPTVIVTSEPTAALVLPLGLWLMTLPTSDCVDVGWVVVWGVKPALLRSSVAWVWVSPRTLGTFFWACPLETSSVTPAPWGTERAVPGLVPITRPVGKRPELCGTVFVTLISPLLRILVAWATDN